MGRSKRLRISQSESQIPTPAPTLVPAPSPSRSPVSSPTITPTPFPAPTPPQTTEPPPETNLASIPDDVSKQCNKYWKVDIIDEQGVVRDGRLKVLEVWSLPAGQRVVVHFNAEAQPVGNAAGLLSGFLGIVVTEVNTFPISYRSWDKVPDSYKEACFNSIKAKFCLDRDIDKHFVIKKLGKNWRNYRVFLFGRFYKVEKTREQNLEKYPQFIPFDMWAAFVDYRLEQKTKEMSAKNRQNRMKLKMPHTCGSKSIAGKKHEMKLESGRPISRGAVFVATHKRKDGSYVNEEAKIVSWLKKSGRKALYASLEKIKEAT